MNHFILLLVCILLVEIVLRLDFFHLINLIHKDTKKILKIAFNSKFSDHWKERSIPVYALKLICTSLKIFLIIFFIFITFIILEFFITGFIGFVASFLGLFESLLFSLTYFFFRKAALK